MTQSDKKTALLTGASRGIGLAICRELSRQGWAILATARDEARLALAAQECGGYGGKIVTIAGDIGNDNFRRELAQTAEERLGALGVLINNAGVYPEAPHAPAAAFSALKQPPDIFRRTLEINLLAPYHLTQLCAPLLVDGGRVINLSSGFGQLSEMGGGAPGYRASKTALNALTRIFAAELAPRKIAVNSVCPGWVKTDMGSDAATRTPEQGADTVVWLATTANPPTGKFLRDREEIPW